MTTGGAAGPGAADRRKPSDRYICARNHVECGGNASASYSCGKHDNAALLARVRFPMTRRERAT